MGEAKSHRLLKPRATGIQERSSVAVGTRCRSFEHAQAGVAPGLSGGHRAAHALGLYQVTIFNRRPINLPSNANGCSRNAFKYPGKAPQVTMPPRISWTPSGFSCSYGSPTMHPS